jgi:tetratricopeptide (TPR) repeat protein
MGHISNPIRMTFSGAAVNGLFLEFRDPLFGIIVFVALIFIIAFVSYWWGRLRSKEDHRYLERFLRSFKKLPSQEQLHREIGSSAVSQKSWLLIAQTYVQNGDFEQAVDIYQSLLQMQHEPHRRRELLLLLAQAYFKAGFLERCETILLKILGRFPRTPQALQLLLFTYERLRSYDKALQMLEPLDELGSNIENDRRYLETVSLLQDPAVDPGEKCRRLAEKYRECHAQTYLTFEFLFRHDPALAWQTLDASGSRVIADILWHLPQEHLNLDIITSDGYLRQLYSARGSVNLAQNSSEFELDVLIKLRQCGQNGANLQFEYLCGHCKQVFPFPFHRCPKCHSIDTVVTEPLLCKETEMFGAADVSERAYEV